MTTTQTQTRRSPMRVVAIVIIGLLVTALGVAPQLSARLTGDEYTFRVEPVDPIDPFRGAYVTLGYPDLQPDQPDQSDQPESGPGTSSVYLPLRQEGEVWVADSALTERPASGPYLTCVNGSWTRDCGIDSYFLPQDEAAAMEQQLRDGALATVRIDRWGNAALISVE